MIKLDFEYDDRSNELIATSGRYRVRAIQDESAECPFTAWDGHWPMITYYRNRGHNFTAYDNCEGPSLDDPIARFSDGQLVRHQSAIIAAIGDGHDVASLAEHKRDYRSDYCSMAALIRDYCSDALQAVSDADKLETFVVLYDLLRIPYLCTSSHGYSQGDYVELLIVATPEACEQFDWKAGQRNSDDFAKDMKSQLSLYSDWVWGDVYGAIVERDGEKIDSCWGFYGSDFDKSGLAEFAQSVIKCDIELRRKARGDKLKKLIRANEPLAARATVLGSSA
jgi:hypothetical protein